MYVKATLLLLLLFAEYEIYVGSSVTEASIDFNDQAVPLTLTITCTDGTSSITGSFDVNIVDAVRLVILCFLSYFKVLALFISFSRFTDYVNYTTVEPYFRDGEL